MDITCKVKITSVDKNALASGYPWWTRFVNTELVPHLTDDMIPEDIRSEVYKSAGIVRFDSDAGMVEFESENHYNWFLLKWSQKYN